VVVLLVLLVVATAATTLASWSNRKKQDLPPRTTEWVDLSTIETRKSGVDRAPGGVGPGNAHHDDTRPEDTGRTDPDT
jgi:hypothetical protein